MRRPTSDFTPRSDQDRALFADQDVAVVQIPVHETLAVHSEHQLSDAAHDSALLERIVVECEIEGSGSFEKGRERMGISS